MQVFVFFPQLSEMSAIFHFVCFKFLHEFKPRGLSHSASRQAPHLSGYSTNRTVLPAQSTWGAVKSGLPSFR